MIDFACYWGDNIFNWRTWKWFELARAWVGLSNVAAYTGGSIGPPEADIESTPMRKNIIKANSDDASALDLIQFFVSETRGFWKHRATTRMLLVITPLNDPTLDFQDH